MKEKKYKKEELLIILSEVFRVYSKQLSPLEKIEDLEKLKRSDIAYNQIYQLINKSL